MEFMPGPQQGHLPSSEDSGEELPNPTSLLRVLIHKTQAYSFQNLRPHLQNSPSRAQKPEGHGDNRSLPSIPSPSLVQHLHTGVYSRECTGTHIHPLCTHRYTNVHMQGYGLLI